MTLPREHDTQAVDTRTSDYVTTQVSTYTKLLILNKVNRVASDEEGNFQTIDLPMNNRLVNMTVARSSIARAIVSQHR